MKITLTALASVMIPEGYSPDDETRDFRRTFLGSSEGVRVLSRIFGASGFFKCAGVGDKATSPSEMLAFFEGRRSVAGDILAAIEREPVKIEVRSEDPDGRK